VARRSRVRAAFLAAARRLAADRRRAADEAWRDSALREAALRPSRFSARRTARDRRLDTRVRRRDARLADSALFRVVDLAPRPGGGNFTPDRRAFDSPMAIACLVERAPCFPSRT
jgi:hypothetical protein